MWIVPRNKELLACVPDMAVLSWDSKELAQYLEPSLMWRSKPTRWQTWLQRLKKVSWMQHLSGRILKPSQHKSFQVKYTASLAVIPASPLAAQDSEKEPMIPDTFGRILLESCRQLDLFGASSRTSPDTLPLDSQKFTEAYEIWVTKLRLESLERGNLVSGIIENGYIFLPTPRASESGGGGGRLTELRKGRFSTLRERSNQYFGATLTDALEINQPKWMVTNPSWIEEQIMGLPIEWTGLGSSATESSPNVQKRHSGI